MNYRQVPGALFTWAYGSTENPLGFLEIEPAVCRRFETGGVPVPTSEMSPRAPAQMGRRETEHEGGKTADGARERGVNPL
jgi:hypothetical protein